MSGEEKSSLTAGDSSTVQPKGRRRGSLFEVGFPSVIRDRGSSMVSIPSIIPSHTHTHLRVRYENTFKLEPDKRFNAQEVKEILEETLEESLQDTKYEAAKCKTLSKSLSHTICERVKLLGFKRFKYVATVTIGEMKGQGVRIASRFLWNEKHDNWVDAVFTSSQLFAVAVVYAIYQE